MTVTAEKPSSPPALGTPGPKSDLDVVNAWLSSWAAAHEVLLLDDAPSGSARVWEAPEEMGVEEFCTLALYAKTPFVYREVVLFEVKMFDEETNHSGIEAAGREQLAVMKEQAAQRDGQCCGLALQFVSNGIVHHWGSIAPWIDAFDTYVAELGEKYGREDEEDMQAPDTPQDPPYTEEDVDRIAAVSSICPRSRRRPPGTTGHASCSTGVRN